MKTVLHIPHSSRFIPDHLRWRYTVSDEELELEILRMTDWYTEELFLSPSCQSIVFPYSRLVVDVERFFDDLQEPMAERGMGWSYTRTSQGTPLTNTLDTSTREFLSTLYWEHHHSLSELVEGNVVILDCHSFPSKALRCDLDQTPGRPDICIGTDSFHTPKDLVSLSYEFFLGFGFSVAINKPYSGSLVPLAVYKKDRSIYSVMIELNRSLYMNEETGKRTGNFAYIQGIVSKFIKFLQAYQGKTH